MKPDTSSHGEERKRKKPMIKVKKRKKCILAEFFLLLNKS